MHSYLFSSNVVDTVNFDPNCRRQLIRSIIGQYKLSSEIERIAFSTTMVRLPVHEYADLFTPFSYIDDYKYGKYDNSIRYIRYHWFTFYTDGDNRVIRIYGNPAVEDKMYKRRR